MTFTGGRKYWNISRGREMNEGGGRDSRGGHTPIHTQNKTGKHTPMCLQRGSLWREQTASYTHRGHTNRRSHLQANSCAGERLSSLCSVFSTAAQNSKQIPEAVNLLLLPLLLLWTLGVYRQLSDWNEDSQINRSIGKPERQTADRSGQREDRDMQRHHRDGRREKSAR